VDSGDYSWLLAGFEPGRIVGYQMWTEMARGEEIEEAGASGATIRTTTKKKRFDICLTG
jgi:hypothetical protein